MTIPRRETSGIFPYPAFELFQKNDSVFSERVRLLPGK